MGPIVFICGEKKKTLRIVNRTRRGRGKEEKREKGPLQENRSNSDRYVKGEKTRTGERQVDEEMVRVIGPSPAQARIAVGRPRIPRAEPVDFVNSKERGEDRTRKGNSSQ